MLSIKQPQYKGALRQTLTLIGTRAYRAYPEESVVAQSIGRPRPITTYTSLDFSFSVTYHRDCAVLLSAGVRCDIIETWVTYHDLPGIRDRIRKQAALSYGRRFR